ncbi:MAG: alpha/beta hydrolase [Hyphomicrobiales bacterium]|nr:alpha/beta hydrolase [Hyphomicrobiales bacterium]
MKLRTLAIGAVAAALAAGVCAFAALTLSPWPRALLIRHDYDRNGETLGAALDARAPTDVTALRDLSYGASADETLDLYLPAGASRERAPPLVVWIHGGGWLSGDKSHVAGYLKMISARGYAVAGVNYSLSPGAIYPTPVRQSFEALAFLAREASRLHVDATRIVLAGDSAGAQTAAQMAEAIADRDYAKASGVTPTIPRTDLRGALLFCGLYDAALLKLDGPGSGIRRTYMWAYAGTKDFLDAPAFAPFSVARYVTANFPPAFVTAGNADPLGGQSLAFAAALGSKGVPVDRLFYAQDHAPPLDHEYQFDLSLSDSVQALARAVAFLDRVTDVKGASP